MAYAPGITHKLMSLGVPFVRRDYTSGSVQFELFVDELKSFCDAEKMGMLL